MSSPAEVIDGEIPKPSELLRFIKPKSNGSVKAKNGQRVFRKAELVEVAYRFMNKDSNVISKDMLRKSSMNNLFSLLKNAKINILKAVEELDEETKKNKDKDVANNQLSVVENNTVKHGIQLEEINPQVPDTQQEQLSSDNVLDVMFDKIYDYLKKTIDALKLLEAALKSDD